MKDPRWMLGACPLNMAYLPIAIRALRDLHGLDAVRIAQGLGGTVCPSDLSYELIADISVVRMGLGQRNVEAGLTDDRNYRILPAPVVMRTGNLGMVRWWGCPCQLRASTLHDQLQALHCAAVPQVEGTQDRHLHLGPSAHK